MKTHTRGGAALAVVAEEPEQMSDGELQREFDGVSERRSQIMRSIDELRDRIDDSYRNPNVTFNSREAMREELHSLTAEQGIVEGRHRELMQRVHVIRMERRRAALDAEMETFRVIEADVAEQGERMLRGLLPAISAWRDYEVTFAQYREWDRRVRRLLGQDRNRAPSLTAPLATGVPADVLQLLRRMSTAMDSHEQRVRAPEPPRAITTKGDPTTHNIGNLSLLKRLLRELRATITRGK